MYRSRAHFVSAPDKWRRLEQATSSGLRRQFGCDEGQEAKTASADEASSTTSGIAVARRPAKAYWMRISAWSPSWCCSAKMLGRDRERCAGCRPRTCRPPDIRSTGFSERSSAEGAEHRHRQGVSRSTSARLRTSAARFAQPQDRRPWEGRPRTPSGSRAWRRCNRARSPGVALYSSCAQSSQWQR